MIRGQHVRPSPLPIRRGPAGSRRIALTFDDGPCARTDEILDILASHDAHATFFMIGKWVPEYEHMLRRLVNYGHEIGNHSFDHADLVGRPVRTIYQIARTARRVRAAVGSAPRLFRPPYTRFDAWVRLAVRIARVRMVTWSVDPRDWSPTTTPAQVHDRVVGAVRDGDIVVLHESEAAGAPTLAALPSMLRALQARGFRMVTVSELLGFRESEVRGPGR
jgi:peptidoglycan-N-acetylglucosamine deacetylase